MHSERRSLAAVRAFELPWLVNTTGKPRWVRRNERKYLNGTGIMTFMIKLFVGLGNPGAEYEDTRHNAGFWFIDQLAQQLKVQLSPDKNYHGWVARTTLQGETIWLLKPATFMNLSGKSVGALARFFKIEPAQILVAHDELDVVPGEAKLKLGGSHAGHNGLRDIHAQLGTDAYWRLRLGIGHPGVKSEVIHWVLKKPAPEQRKVIDTCIDRSLTAVALMVSGDMVKATQQVHTSKPPRPKPPRPAAAAPTKEGELHEKPPPAPGADNRSA
jgi:PTH1 family peptidyl-tRNA hydrolase